MSSKTRGAHTTDEGREGADSGGRSIGAVRAADKAMTAAAA